MNVKAVGGRHRGFSSSRVQELLLQLAVDQRRDEILTGALDASGLGRIDSNRQSPMHVFLFFAGKLPYLFVHAGQDSIACEFFGSFSSTLE